MKLADNRSVNQALLASGATISEMNTVRKQLSNIKGRRLAQAAYPAKVVSLVISDVPGDDPSEIASGPTVANTTTIEEASEIVARYKLDLPIAAQEVLARGGSLDTRRPMNTEVRLIASPSLALAAAADVARANGLRRLLSAMHWRVNLVKSALYFQALPDRRSRKGCR
ncbi:glycerate-2-kinase [Agrobacterium vitis]|nr:glycerate-2-kinase [Agrobacterium vitis]MBE1440482.1 glycerate-2-kinase [Agrobacterium vitis]